MTGGKSGPGKLKSGRYGPFDDTTLGPFGPLMGNKIVGTLHKQLGAAAAAVVVAELSL